MPAAAARDPASFWGALPFWEALHRRTCDRVTSPWARAWLASHTRLEPATAAGWPVLRLVLEADPPPPVSPYLLRCHYRDALAAGVLADLTASLEVTL
ncbi:MAG: hypothetical protein RLZZ468_436 [Cyanobacteriota bacterium]|jgi:hypothetical protein